MSVVRRASGKSPAVTAILSAGDRGPRFQQGCQERVTARSDSEKLHNMFDEFEYLLLGFMAFGYLRR